MNFPQTRWLLPPQRTAWIAADVPIRVSVRAPVSCASVLFARQALLPPLPCQVFTVSPLARERQRSCLRLSGGLLRIALKECEGDVLP
jgi:hypothetical protein